MEWATHNPWVRDWAPLQYLNTTTNSPAIIDFNMPSEHYIGREAEIGLAWEKHWNATRVSLPLLLEGGNLACNSKVCLTSSKLIHDNSSSLDKERAFARSKYSIVECDSAGCRTTTFPSLVNERTFYTDTDFVVSNTVDFADATKSLQEVFSKISTQRLLVLPKVDLEPTGHVDMFLTFLREDLLVVADIPDDAINRLEGDTKNNALHLKRALSKWVTLLNAFFAENKVAIEILRIDMGIPNFAAKIWPSYTNNLQIKTDHAHYLFMPTYMCIKNCETELFPNQRQISKLESEIDKLLTARGFTLKWENATGLIRDEGSLHCATANVPK